MSVGVEFIEQNESGPGVRLREGCDSSHAWIYVTTKNAGRPHKHHYIPLLLYQTLGAGGW